MWMNRLVKICILVGAILLTDFSELNAQIFVKTDLNSGIHFISKYIASEKFTNLSELNNDLEFVDSIYLNTLRFYDYDYSETLLALAFGTLPFAEMPITVPIIGVKIDVPLPSVSDSLFKLKLQNLPSHFLEDSPANEFGDKDKLAHFFGNAFLTYNVSFFKLSDFMSIFVEVFESTLKVQGAVDSRDLYVNNLGQNFGDSLRTNKQILPSHFLK